MKTTERLLDHKYLAAQGRVVLTGAQAAFRQHSLSRKNDHLPTQVQDNLSQFDIAFSMFWHA